MSAELSEEEKKLLCGVLKDNIVKTEATGIKKEIAQMNDNEAMTHLFGEVVDLYIRFPQLREKTGLTIPALKQKIDQMSKQDAKQFLLKEILEEEPSISSKEDLKDFPELRKIEIAKMSDKDQITYMLTGMKYDEYQKKIAQFADNERIDEAVGNFDNESGEVLKNIKDTNKSIEWILGLDKEKRK